MCILFLHLCDNPEPGGYRLIAASNRDEFYNRPTAAAGFNWNEKKLLGGKQMRAAHTVFFNNLKTNVVNSLFRDSLGDEGCHCVDRQSCTFCSRRQLVRVV